MLTTLSLIDQLRALTGEERMDLHERDDTPLAGDEADVRAELLGDWQWQSWMGGSAVGYIGTTTWTSRVAAESIPAFVKAREYLATFGYSPASDAIHVAKYIEKGGDWAENEKTHYAVSDQARFVKGDGAIVVSFQVREAATLAAALNTCTYLLGDVRYVGEPVEGGKGQLTTCKSIARRLYQEHGQLMTAQWAKVVVPYETRGGRGGWKRKIAERVWKPEELTK